MKENDKIINELRKAYDTMLPHQIDQNIENISTEPLSDASRQRIREMVNQKMNTANKKNRKTVIRRWAAVAAAFAVVLTCGIVFSSESVRASIAKLFGFAPNVGIVESVDPDAPFFISERGDVTDGNDMIEVTIKDAVIFNDTLEVRYVLNLTAISEKDLYNNLNSLDELYLSKGYGNYFEPLDHGFSVSPLSQVTLMGSTPSLLSTSVPGSEDILSGKYICISQTYDVKDMEFEAAPQGVLTVGDVSVDFRMNKVDLTSDAESIGAISEIDGIKVLCVPFLDGDTLSLDYYLCDSGEYTSDVSFRRYGIDTTRLLVGDTSPDGYEGTTLIDGMYDIGYMFYSENSNHIDSRFNYDLSSIEEGSDITVKAEGIYAKKLYDNKALTFDAALSEEKTVNEVIDFDGAKLEIAKISHVVYDEDEGYEEYENGYLVLTAAIDNSENEQFIGLSEIGINGIVTDGFYFSQYDLDYITVSIPLPVPYSEVRSVEFASADMFLSGEMEFDLTGYVW